MMADDDGACFVIRWRQENGLWRVLTEAEFGLGPIGPGTPMRPRTYTECMRWRNDAPVPTDLEIVEVASADPAA
jgi:hypothetical protein